MKKSLAILLSFSMVFGLVACSNGKERESSSAEVAESSTSGTESVSSSSVEKEDATAYAVTEPITIEFWNPLPEEDKVTWMEEKVQEYNESQDMVTVNMVNISGLYSGTDEQLAAAQASGTGLPAVALINCPRVLTYASNNMEEPLDGYIEATGYDIEDFNSGMMEAMVLDSDGQTYGMPFGISSGVCYWNMELLKEAGIDKIPETWEELKEAAPVIKEKTGQLAFGVVSELNYIEVLMRNAGADPLGDGTTCNMQDEHIINFLKEFKEMIDTGEAQLFTGTDMATNLITSFSAGNVACVFHTCAVVNQISEKVDFEVATSFALKDELDPAISCVAGASMIMLAANDQAVKNAAWDFMSWILNKENMSSWAFVSGYYPNRTSILEDEETMTKLYEKQPLYEGIYEGLDGIVSKNKSPYQTAAYKILLNAMEQYFYDNADLEKVWSQAEEEINYLLAGN